MAGTLDEAIRNAMLHWLLESDDWEPELEPVEVTGWEEYPYSPAVDDTCGDDPARIIIRYKDAEGEEDFEVVDRDFGAFIRELTDMEAKRD